MTKQEIRDLITLTKKAGGDLTLSYIPKDVIKSNKKLYALYYGGWNKIEIGKYFRNGSDFFEIDESNLNSVIDKVYDCLSDSIGEEILQALQNLKWQPEELKYFDRPESKENLKIFKKEVLKLKKENSSDTQKTLAS